MEAMGDDHDVAEWSQRLVLCWSMSSLNSLPCRPWCPVCQRVCDLGFHLIGKLETSMRPDLYTVMIKNT